MRYMLLKRFILWILPIIKRLYRQGAIPPKVISICLSVMLSGITIVVVGSGVLGLTYLGAFVIHLIKTWAW